jgi:hypothetical protein
VTDTPTLIALLTQQAHPVRPLRPPLHRAAAWLLLAAAILVLFLALHGPRPDLLERLHDPLYFASVTGAVMTGILAAIAAFELSLPDRSTLWRWLPAPALLLWIWTIGYGCAAAWVAIAPGTVTLENMLRCLATLVLTSLPLSLLLVVMLRHAVPLRPILVSGYGALAVSGITAAALSTFHEIDATVMILIWNIGTAALLVSIGCALGRWRMSSVGMRSVA